MGGELYFRHEIDRNPAASDAGKIKAYATMATYRQEAQDVDFFAQTFEYTWLAEDIKEHGGLASKLQDVYELFMELEFPQEESLEAMIGVLNCDVIHLTSSANYSRDCALSLWFTFRAPLPPDPSTFAHPIEDDEDDETTNHNILIRAASKLAVKSLIRKKYNKGGSLVSDSCTICLEEFEDGAILVALTCGHEFDDECIADWFAIDHVCPLCRFELPREYEEN